MSSIFKAVQKINFVPIIILKIISFFLHHSILKLIFHFLCYGKYILFKKNLFFISNALMYHHFVYFFFINLPRV